MFVIYGMPTTLIDTSYSYIMSSCLHSHHILKYVILSCLVSHHTCEIVSRFPLISHHICEIMSCYSVWLDNINVNYFMPCFLPYYPLHLSILQCLYIQLLFLFISHFNWRSDGSICGSKNTISEKIMLPVDGDRTTVVLAQELAPPHITQTHADCTPTQL